MSAFFAASAAQTGLKPSFTACAWFGVPSSSLTITLTPLSRRFCAWACPWLP